MALPDPDASRTCLVTGASSGIGAEIARELARLGHGLVLVARRLDRLDSLAKELSTRHGIRAETISVDLSDVEERARLATEVAALGLTVEVLVNNAGFTTMGPSYRAARDVELAMLRTNVEAVVDLCALFTPAMASRRRGAVLNTASTAAFQPLPGQAGYGASKAFVLSYSLAIGAELRGVGVSVTALCPGPVKTGFGEVAGLSDEEAMGALPRFMWIPAEQVARAGVEGMAQGRAVVIPGIANRIGALAGHLAPTPLITKVLAAQHPALRDRH